MGNCPNACCLRNVKIEKDLKVDIIKTIKTTSNNIYLTQPNYSNLVYLQTRIKRFLNNKNYQKNNSQNNNPKAITNASYNKIISNSNNTAHLQKEATAQFNRNFRQQTTEKDENEDTTNNNYNKMDLAEDKKLPKIFLVKLANIFQEDIFSHSNQKIDKNAKNLDPRNGPFDNKRRTYPKIYKGEFSYEGQWKNGKRDGIGILTRKDVANFMGEFVEDKVNGFGKFIVENECDYIGYWKDSKVNGYGIYNNKGIKSYKGIWKDDEQNGFGIEKLPKIEYIGEFIKGNKEGYGVLNIKNAKYEGEISNGNFNGIGTFTFDDKRKYQGEFVNNKIEGYGVFTWPDGKFFVGSFKNDLIDGFGVFYTSKKIYIGVWQHLSLNGEVIVIEGDKRKKQLWEQGKCYKNLPSNHKIYFEKYVDNIIQEKDFFSK